MELFSRALLDSLLKRWVIDGGIMMFVLVPCSLLMVGGILQGIIALRRGRMIPASLLRQAHQVKDTATRRRFVEGLRGQNSPLARLLWLTLKELDWRAGRPASQAVKIPFEEAIEQIADELYEKTGLLSTLYTIGPLMGLLGTTFGLIDNFYRFGSLQQASIQDLSIGVQEALVNTVWGLTIAIPAYVAVQWMQGRIWKYERRHLPEAFDAVLEAIYTTRPEAAPPSQPRPEGAPAHASAAAKAEPHA